MTARTADLIWTTGAPVLRRDWEIGRYFEELSLHPKHVRMGRLNNGAPLLNTHRAFDLESVLGVVESARLEGGQGIATVRFARAEDHPDADRVLRLVRDGIIQNVSVGYSIHRLEKVESSDAKIPTYRATDWEPYELSLVPMGADDGAGVRSARRPQTNRCEIVISRNQETHVDDEIDIDTGDEITLDEGAERRAPQSNRAERARAAGILRSVEAARLPISFARELIDSGLTLDAARAKVIDTLAERADANPTGGHLAADDAFLYGRTFEAPGERGIRGEDEFVAAATDAMLLRAGITVPNQRPAARDLCGMSTIGMWRALFSQRGIRHAHMSDAAFSKRLLTTSDFPLITGNAVHKAAGLGYEQEPASHKLWVRVQAVPDFKSQSRLVLGSGPDLLHVLERGEYKNGPLAEQGATIAVRKWGRIVDISYEMIVNDDLGLFMRMQPGLGQAARRAEADNVYDVLAENSATGPTMSDGTVMFHADHANITAAAAGVDADSLGAARALLRKQTAVGGGYLSLVPKFVIVPASLETDAEIVLASATKHVTAKTEANQPEWIGNLVLVVEPRLPDSAYYVACSTTQADTVELAVLDENINGPTIEQEEGFRTDSLSFKVRHSFQSGAIDHRGMVKIPLS